MRTAHYGTAQQVQDRRSQLALHRTHARVTEGSKAAPSPEFNSVTHPVPGLFNPAAAWR